MAQQKVYLTVGDAIRREETAPVDTFNSSGLPFVEFGNLKAGALSIAINNTLIVNLSHESAYASQGDEGNGLRALEKRSDSTFILAVDSRSASRSCPDEREVDVTGGIESP
jgi:hypothetical protein